MAEQIKPLSPAEVAYLALLTRLREKKIAKARADYATGFAVLCDQHQIVPGTRVEIASAMGPIPARLIYDDGVPSSQQTSQNPAESTAE